MLRLHTSDYLPKYTCGKWFFNEESEKIEFTPYTDLETANDEYMATNGYQFRRTLNNIEELIFRQEYVHYRFLDDSDIITIKDIRNLVIYMMPASFLKYDFLVFLFTKEVYQLLHALIIYFEYFIRMVEFILIKRDEISSETSAQIQSTQSIEIRRIYAQHLTQYRLLVAREYSLILLGKGDMAKYYHMQPIVNISLTIRDKEFHERFLAVCTQIVWIAMHRRAYGIINMEMNRLFRSEHFSLPRVEAIQYSKAEAAMLYGPNYKRRNYRAQNSPLLQELASVSDENLPILWIGERKYRGTCRRIAEIELEYIVPGSQLSLIDMPHGILGHPKKFYNTLLQLDWSAVRFEHFTKDNDPYHILRQPYLKVPRLDDEQLRKSAKHFEQYFRIILHHSTVEPKMIKKYLDRTEIYKKCIKGKIIKTVFQRAEDEMEQEARESNIQDIIAKFKLNKEITVKKKLQ